MKRNLLLTLLVVLGCVSLSAKPVHSKLTSPQKRVSVDVDGERFAIHYKGKPVITFSTNGFQNGETQAKFGKTGKTEADYTMLAGKRTHCANTANEYRATLSVNKELVIRVYNDGIAFRYEYKQLEGGAIPAEQTTYRIPEGTKRWIQQWSDAYEGFFPLTTSYKTLPVHSFSGTFKDADGWNNRWGYPALIEASEGVFALITEANIERKQSASCLFNDKELYRVVPDENKATLGATWHTPWRVVLVGSLKDIVESTLVTDVSEPSRLTDTSWIHPGVVSWVYWAYNHGSNDYGIICRYVDMAARLGLPYVLIDAEWDQMKDGKTVEDAVAYARSKGVKPMIWYNSSVGWVDGAPTPKYRLNKAEDREREFAWCESIGVAGVKIDFFSGDNQMNMDYCLDLLECAARHHLLMNFHGATIPRGWQRTWPNLLSTEGVYGAEWYNNVPTFTKKAAAHNATLPFTRNVVGPMDYTPCAFSDSQHPHITSKAHELALTVLFESGLQHLADRPESFYAQPQAVQDFLGELPAAWDDTRYIGGYPGEYAVIARKSGTRWYVAGINGTDEQKTITLNLKRFIGNKKAVTLYLDDTSGAWDIQNTQDIPESITCQARGGFVAVFN